MSEPLPKWVEPAMALPEGKACSDCVHLARCQMLFGCKPENRWCDFHPVRFREKAVDHGT